MDSYSESKKQLIDLIDSLNANEAVTAIEIIQAIGSGSGINIHLTNSDICYANITNKFLKITINDYNLCGRKNHHPDKTPFTISINRILDEYVITNGEKFITDPNFVIKGCDEIQFKDGDRVVFRDYIFT